MAGVLARRQLFVEAARAQRAVRAFGGGVLPHLAADVRHRLRGLQLTCARRNNDKVKVDYVLLTLLKARFLQKVQYFNFLFVVFPTMVQCVVSQLLACLLRNVPIAC